MSDTQQSESYRDKLATVDNQGKRIWIYPKKPAGPYHKARVWVAIVLMALFFAGPFIQINSRPVLQLGLLERKFIIFGFGFFPQDFHIFVLLTISLIIFIVLFTVAFGRIWCGWTCPQTIFMEMLFRKIEYWIEGDAHKQRLLNLSPMDGTKFFKKTLKHIIFYSLSFFIGNTFLAYIIGKDAWLKLITDPTLQHVGGLTAMIIFSAVFYGVFAFLREQVCTLVCPYGRLQSVMLDQNSIVVHYDFRRGEPRGKISQQTGGDCVDCNMCVNVCPTGMDIRYGTQLECINCTACMDACDSMMQKVKRPKGLIRYASYNMINKGEKFQFSPRLIGYSIVLSLLVIILTILLFTRAPLEATILRTPGSLYQQTEDGFVTNIYNVKIVNKTFEEKIIDLELKSPNGQLELIGGKLKVAEGDVAQTSFLVKLPKEQIRFNNSPISINIKSGEKLVVEKRTSFIGPVFKK
jgi:cytochrome c oxidase accessory protein FixG